MNNFLQASNEPLIDIAKVAYDGQPEKMRLYHTGYERFMEGMPVLADDDELLNEKVHLTKTVVQKMASELVTDPWLIDQPALDEKSFQRTIMALETPTVGLDGQLIGGHELVVAQWGNGFMSPVHGHAIGYLHEEILFGEMLVNTYRMRAPDSNIVRLVNTDTYTKGTFASLYTPFNPNNKFKRQTLIHNFRSIGYSASLHYLSEHTRDGRDNKFVPEYFEDWFDLEQADLQRITSKDGMYLQRGDVVLVRSSNVPWFGDHYITVTGGVVPKAHGMRVQEITIDAPHSNKLLDEHESFDGLVLLKLKNGAKRAFYEFHGIETVNGVPTFPKA